MSEFTWFIVDEWQGLYKDGELIMQDHSLHPIYFAKELGITLSNYDDNIDEYLIEHGGFPENIEELPKYDIES